MHSLTHIQVKLAVKIMDSNIYIKVGAADMANVTNIDSRYRRYWYSKPLAKYRDFKHAFDTKLI